MSLDTSVVESPIARTEAEDLMTAPDSSSDATQDLRFMERVMIQHAHPLELSCDSTGVVVCLYLTWRHRLPAGLTVLLGSSVLGSLLVRRAATRQLAATRLGRWMLGQARPVNLVVRTAGFVVLLTGVWRHSTGLIVGGAGAIVAARPLSGRSPRPRAQRSRAQRLRRSRQLLDQSRRSGD